MADLGRWTGNNESFGNLPESWTAPASLFPTQQRNDGSAYSFAAATSTLTLPASDLADGYLLIAYYEFTEAATANRFNPQGKIIQASGTGNFVGGPTGGFHRDPSEDVSWVRCWAFVDSPSASATFQFQWKADTDDANAASSVDSAFEVIPFYYADIGIYTSSSSALYGGTTPNQVTGWGTTLEGTNITRTGEVITVTGDNKTYLVLGSQFFEGRAGRTQRWHGFEIDNAQENAAKAYSYYRNAANDQSGEMFTWLFQTVTASVTIEQTCYRGDGVGAGQGGADSDGSTPAVGDHATVVIELNDSAEVFLCVGNGGQNLATTGPIDLTICDTTDVQINDAASFTRATDTGMNAEGAMDALLGANIAAAQNTVSATTRWTAQANFTVDGVEDVDTRAGDYQRNNQSSIDTFGWSANLLSFVALAANEDIGVSVTELVGSEGGGGNIDVPDGWEGFWGINLDTLQAAGGGGLPPSGIGHRGILGGGQIDGAMIA